MIHLLFRGKSLRKKKSIKSTITKGKEHLVQDYKDNTYKSFFYLIRKFRGDTNGVDGVVLAAGLSSRAKTYKMELKFGDKTLIEKSIEGMLGVCSKIIVVGGYQSERITNILEKYPTVEVVFNQNYLNGMFSSVKEGLRHVTEKRFFILPGDYPLIKKEIYKCMLLRYEDIIIPTYKGKKGHPVLLNSRLINEIIKEPSDSNLREFIKSKGHTLVETDDPGVLVDVDTLDDYKKLI